MPTVECGTIRATEGFRRITRLGPQTRVRVLGFALVFALGGGLLVWIVRATWNQLERLQKEHAAVKSESFYVGVSLRSSIRSLNDTLLRFYLSEDPSEERQLLQEAQALNKWILTNHVQLAALADLRLLKTLEIARQMRLLREAQNEYDLYWKEVETLCGELHSPAPVPFDRTYQRVREVSRRLIGICDELVIAQRGAFGVFLAQTQTTLVRHQRLLTLFLAVIVALTLALGMLVYRGMIAPLLLGLKESRKIIQRQEKLASLGTLASGVAHEIRNPLTAIKFRLFSLQQTFPALARSEDAMVIADEINRLERIVRDFLQFARPSEPELAPLSPEQLFNDVNALMQPQLARSRIRLRIFPGEPVQVRGDAQQLKQVLINLIQNAAEAIGQDGTITLSARREAGELDGIGQLLVVLAVADTGKGIPEEVETRLFDPFFTTKEGGAGLGLAMASRIVEKHGGMLRYQTQVDRGTTFEVVLPSFPDHASQTSADRG